MDSDRHQNRGLPHPPEVYRRRRAAAVLVLLFLLLGGFFGIRALVADPPDNSAAPAVEEPLPPPASETSATVTPSQSGSATTAAAPPPVCAPEAVKVQASAAPASIPRGSKALLRMTVTNNSAAPCSLDVGSEAVEVMVQDAGGTVWSSDHCQGETRSNVEVIAPGKKLETAIDWAPHRTSPGCPTGLATLTAGEYNVVTRVGEYRSEPVKVTVLG